MILNQLIFDNFESNYTLTDDKHKITIAEKTHIFEISFSALKINFSYRLNVQYYQNYSE